MTRRTTRTTKPAPVGPELKVTPEEGKIENISTEVKAAEPVNLEVETPLEEPTPAPEAMLTEKIQTEFSEKLANRSVDENIFVPSNPASLEKAAQQLAKECGFEYTRGRAIGARLMARAQQRGF